MSIPVNTTVTEADKAIDPLVVLRLYEKIECGADARVAIALARRLLAAENTIRSLSEILYGRPDACVAPNDVQEMLRDRSKAQLRAVAAEAELARLKSALEETR